MKKLSLGSDIEELSGVGKVRAAQLKKLGISTIGDLIYYFPRAYENRGNIRPLSHFSEDEPTSHLLTIATEVKSTLIRKGLTISKLRAFDESGSCEIVFFNSPYVKDVFHVGSVFRIYGRAAVTKNKISFTNPKYEPYVEGYPLSDLIPIYSLTEGVSSKQLDKLSRQAINEVLPELIDALPEGIRQRNSLPTITYAIKNAHFPESPDALRASLKRLAFEELFYFGIGISSSASRKNSSEGIKFSKIDLKPFCDRLPYELTGSQKNAINDVYRDTVIGKDGKISPMARIIVGDVGCGKTVCALASIYLAVKSGYQAALMVPTEILARQHYEDARELLGALSIRCELLLGSTSQKEKKCIKEALRCGDIDVIIGTHALISDSTEFNNLGLVITDEQHRFGVAQRAALKDKSSKAHLLVMSATPIPRTLALAMYGDLDVSRITDMPKGRMRVDTYVVDESYRTRLNDFLAKQVKLGGQCYVVCPSIERGDEGEEGFVPDSLSGEMVSSKSLKLKNATEYREELSSALPSLRIDLLHGKMKATEKDAVMERFSKGEVDILVSTTVIEVGVNVPNASLMVVENAERFGLSQLHQLRGRVGRGSRKSYCVLVSDNKSGKSRDRLDVMKSTYDGYEIAEKDLVLRGPGDFFSQVSDDNIRQSGGLDLKFASLCDDGELVSAAFSEAKMVTSCDPALSLPEHELLRRECERRLKINLSSLS